MTRQRKCTMIVPPWYEAQICGAKYAQITSGEVKLTYLDDTTETRKRTSKPLPKEFFGLVSFVQAGRAR